MNYIFDFDGTIVDSFEYVLDFLSKEAKKETPKGKQAELFRNRSMKDMALGLGISYWRLPFLYFKGRRVMRAHMDDLRAFKGMEEVIRELDARGHKLFIVSSNSSRNIKRFLIKNKLNQCFYAVTGSAGLFGKDNIIRSLKRKYKITGETWYVGDELTDIRAARAANIKSVAVTWGFASTNELASKNPDVLIFQPKELLVVGAPESGDSKP